MKRALAIMFWTSVALTNALPASRASDEVVLLDMLDSIQEPAAIVEPPVKTAAETVTDVKPTVLPAVATSSGGSASRPSGATASLLSSVVDLEPGRVQKVGYLDVDFKDAPAEAPAEPVCRPEVFGGISYLSLTPSLRGLDYAVTEDGTSLTVGRGEIHSLEHETDAGIRALLGYRTATGWGLAVRYSTIEFAGEDHVVRPSGTGQLFATRTHPDGNEEADTADAFGDLSYHVFDLEASNRIIDERFIELNIFGGVRWAKFEMSNSIDYDGRDFVLGKLRDSLETSGVGLQVGSEGSWKLMGGFALTGRISGGLMRANFNTHRLETNLDDAVVLVDATNEFDQAMPNVEFAGGVSWSRGPLTISAAYELVNWFNAYDRGMFVDDIHEASYGPFSEDILLEGFSLTTTFSR